MHALLELGQLPELNQGDGSHPRPRRHTRHSAARLLSKPLQSTSSYSTSCDVCMQERASLAPRLDKDLDNAAPRLFRQPTQKFCARKLCHDVRVMSGLLIEMTSIVRRRGSEAGVCRAESHTHPRVQDLIQLIRLKSLEMLGYPRAQTTFDRPMPSSKRLLRHALRSP